MFDFDICVNPLGTPEIVFVSWVGNQDIKYGGEKVFLNEKIYKRCVFVFFSNI